MTITRREMCSMIPGLLPAAAALDAFAEADTSLPSADYPYDKLPVHTFNQAEIRPVLKGKLATGEALEVHETTLPPGGAPHAPHHHTHSEMWLIREGTVELTVNGASYRLGPGAVTVRQLEYPPARGGQAQLSASRRGQAPPGRRHSIAPMRMGCRTPSVRRR